VAEIVQTWHGMIMRVLGNNESTMVFGAGSFQGAHTAVGGNSIIFQVDGLFETGSEMNGFSFLVNLNLFGWRDGRPAYYNGSLTVTAVVYIYHIVLEFGLF
jgi:hypothetical protein